MLIPKPFIIIKISDSDRVPLDIIKLIMPSMGGEGGQIKNGMSHYQLLFNFGLKDSLLFVLNITDTSMLTGDQQQQNTILYWQKKEVINCIMKNWIIR